jgi:hypothetical protein
MIAICDAQYPNATIEAEFFSLINGWRASVGVQTVTENLFFDSVAQVGTQVCFYIFESK